MSEYVWPATVLIIFLGMLVIVWRALSIAHDLSKIVLQAGLKATVPPVAPTIQPIPKPTPVPPPVPKPTGPFADAPSWFQGAVHEIGFHETGNNQGIERYISMAHTGSIGDPWCAIFANAMLEQTGIPGTRSPSSQSFCNSPNFVELNEPALGAIAVFWRGSQASGLGHVGFYRGEDSSKVWVLGGNENDMVQIEALSKSGASFGLIGYWWPKSIPLPTTGPVLMPSGSPTSIKTFEPPSIAASGNTPTGWQTNIIATYFGGRQSAYGPPIDDNSLGVALPFHFQDPRPRVRVTGKRTGQSIDCDIVDVGPLNTNDPYWETGTRPQAETGTDTRGRHTNKAGIDLTLAGAKAISIDGKGLVDWEFISGPTIEQPKVT